MSLFEGLAIHATPSVKPAPIQMKGMAEKSTDSFILVSKKNVSRLVKMYQVTFSVCGGLVDLECNSGVLHLALISEFECPRDTVQELLYSM